MLTAFAEKGIDKMDPFASGVAERGGGGCVSPRDRVHACTLEAYVEARGLSIAFLRNRPCPRACRGLYTRLHACIPGRQSPSPPPAWHKWLELNRSVASCRVHSATDRGYLHDLKDTLRKPSYLAPTDPLPEDLEICRPDALADAYKACKRTGETEGRHTSSPLQTPMRTR